MGGGCFLFFLFKSSPPSYYSSSYPPLPSERIAPPPLPLVGSVTCYIITDNWTRGIELQHGHPARFPRHPHSQRSHERNRSGNDFFPSRYHDCRESPPIAHHLSFPFISYSSFSGFFLLTFIHQLKNNDRRSLGANSSRATQTATNWKSRRISGCTGAWSSP